MAQKTLTVKWLLTKKRIIKFKEEPDTTYDIVASIENLDSIKIDSIISVNIEDGKITSIKKPEEQKAKSETKEKVKEEPKKEVQKDSEVKQWTIEAMTSAKDVVKFKEGEVKWYVIAPEIVSDFQLLNKDDIVTVVIGTVEQAGKEKPGVVAIKNVTRKEVEEKNTEKPKKTTSNSTGNSIERQCALKSATKIVVALIEKQDMTTEAIQNSIKNLTKVCYQAIQEA